MGVLVPFPDTKDIVRNEELLFMCDCITDEEREDNIVSVFYVYMDRYVCCHCDKEHSFEDAHGSID